MNLDFYELKEQPFKGPPDRKFLYVSSTHQQALASLQQALQDGRKLVTLQAEPGLGKTILLYHILNSFDDKVATTIYIRQAAQGLHVSLQHREYFMRAERPSDVLYAFLADLGDREIEEKLQGMLSQLQNLIAKQHRFGKRVIIALDDAQDLDASLLELVILLSALPTARGRLIQFILCGQPLLIEKLVATKTKSEMRHGAPAAHLKYMSAQDTARYLDHRLRTAGYYRELPLFTPDAAALVARFSGGKPRIINSLCFEVLAEAYRRRRKRIGPDIVRNVASTRARSGRPSAFWQSFRPSSALLAVAFSPPQRPRSAMPKHGAECVCEPLGRSSLQTQSNAAIGRVISFILPKASKSQPAAQNRRSHHRTSVAHLFSGLPIAAVMLLIFLGAAYAVHRATTSASDRRPTLPASMMLHPSATMVQERAAPSVMAARPQAASGMTRQDTNTAADATAANQDLKGMDLQNSLRALSSRTKRKQQNQLRKTR